MVRGYIHGVLRAALTPVRSGLGLMLAYSIPPLREVPLPRSGGALFGNMRGGESPSRRKPPTLERKPDRADPVLVIPGKVRKPSTTSSRIRDRRVRDRVMRERAVVVGSRTPGYRTLSRGCAERALLRVRTAWRRASYSRGKRPTSPAVGGREKSLPRGLWRGSQDAGSLGFRPARSTTQPERDSVSASREN